MYKKGILVLLIVALITTLPVSTLATKKENLYPENLTLVEEYEVITDPEKIEEKAQNVAE